MRPPECDVCGAELDPGAEPVRFQPDEMSRAWAERSSDGEVGHDPEIGWFCSAHRWAAREAARTLSRTAGLAQVIAGTGWVVPQRDATPPIPATPPTSTISPVPTHADPPPFDPRTYVLLDPPGLPEGVEVPERDSDAITFAQNNQRALLLDALAPDTYRGHWSNGSNEGSGPPRPSAWATAGDRTILDSDFCELDLDGNRVAHRIERRVERNGEVEVLIRSYASTLDGPEPAFDRLIVWVGDERFRSWAEAVAAELRTAPRDLLDPAPDLVGVDLAGGRLTESHRISEVQWVDWTLDRVSWRVVLDQFVALAVDLAAASGQTLPRLTTTTERLYTPMDGATEPNCPFAETDHTVGDADGIEYSLRVDRSHWDEGSPHRVSMALSIEGLDAHPEPLWLYASGIDGEYLTSLTLRRPTTADLVARAGALAATLPGDAPDEEKGRHGR